MKNLEVLLVDCEINIILTWSADWSKIDASIANQIQTFTITDIKLYIPVVTLPTKDNAKLLEQLKSGFKRIINWNKHKSKVRVKEKIWYLYYLIKSMFSEQ